MRCEFVEIGRTLCAEVDSVFNGEYRVKKCEYEHHLDDSIGRSRR